MPTKSNLAEAVAPKGRSRLTHDARRQQLISVAAALLGEGGADSVQISEVALRAEVTRPVVYKFFPNRIALIVAVLDDFERDMNARFSETFRENMPGSLAEIAGIFIASVCNTIEAKGTGPWYLLGAKGPDPEIGQAAADIQDRLLEPWRAHIATLTNATASEVECVSQMLVATGRATLDLWLADRLGRDEAIQHAARAAGALLTAFTRSEGDA
jgi:AcrR family transcriptional regulator